MQKRETKIFFDFQNCDKCAKTRNSNESHPGIYFRIGVSPQDKNNIIHNSKLKDYEKSKSNCNN